MSRACGDSFIFGGIPIFDFIQCRHFVDFILLRGDRLAYVNFDLGARV